MSDVTYRITVVYGDRSRPLTDRRVPTGGQQTHERLEEDRARQGVEAFIEDLFRFHGNGVSSLTITAERTDGGE